MKQFILLIAFILIVSFTSCTSETCQTTSDCQIANHCVNGKCKHDSILPITLMDCIGLICIFFASAFSNAGGIGGGTLFLPVIILILHFYTHEAIPISKIVIFTGSLASFALNIRLKHPVREAVALDYNLIILIVPNLLFGTMLGVTMNKMLPSIVIIVCLTVILVFNTYKTVSMGINQYRIENNAQALKQEDKINTSGKKIKEMSERNDNDANINSQSRAIDEDDTELRLELLKDNRILRWEKLQYVLIPFLIMALLSILRESSLIRRCSLWYWSLFGVYLIIGVFFHIVAIRQVKTEYSKRIALGYPYDSNDIIWSTNKCITIGCLGIVSGFIAGTIGIGGGVILGPILLSLGIHPVVSTVTTNFLVLLTSSSTSLQFMLSHMLNYEYSSISIVFSMLGSFMGTKLVHHYFKKTGRESILIFALVIVIGVSALILPATSIISTIQDMKKDINPFTFSSPCLN